MSTMRNDISITSILYNIRWIKDVSIIGSITSLWSCKCHCTVRSWCIVSMTLFLAFNFVLRTNVICMCRILKVNIILTINLDNVATFDFVDNISVIKLIVRISHQKFFTENRIKRNFTIVIMEMITVWSHITLVGNFHYNLFCLNIFLFANLIWCLSFCFLRVLLPIDIRHTVIILVSFYLVLVQCIDAKT